MADEARYRFTKGRRPGPGPDPRVDTLLAMVMALTSEVAVLRERLDAHEKLSAQGKPIDTAAVDSFQPSAAEEAQRASLRDRLLDKVCRPLIASGQMESADE